MRVPIWCVAPLLAVTPARAYAAGDGPPPRGSVVVDRLGLAGDAGSDIEQAIREAIVRGLTGEGVQIVEPGEAGPAGPCSNAECVAGLAAASGASHVVGGSVQVTQRSYDLTLELHGRDGRVLATKGASCPICSVPEAEEAAATAAAELAGSLTPPEAAVEEPPLTITSNPSGALVYLDGALAGTTPFARPIAPGVHQLEVRMEGHTTVTRELTVDPSTPPAPLDLVLVPKKGASPLLPLGWTAVAIGAASLITGVALIALDEDPYKARCEGPDVDAFGRCRYRYDTLAGGIAGVVVGAALVGGGVGLLVLDRKRRRAPSDARAALRVVPGAGGLALAGRF